MYSRGIMAYKYWFDIPTLEGREIHITPWDVAGVFSDLPPPLVAAVRKEDWKEYTGSTLMERLRYTMEHGGIGTLIPDADFLITNSTVERLDEIMKNINDFPQEQFSSKMEELLISLFPVHRSAPNTDTLEPVYRFGFSNSILPALKQGTGECQEKATFTLFYNPKSEIRNRLRSSA